MQNRKAFTMVELVFVIVVIGILSAVAIPKLAATRDDAEISRARTVVASLRNAISTERQKQILAGKFDDINASTAKDLLMYQKWDGTSGWTVSDETFIFKTNGQTCTFTVSKNQLTTNGTDCSIEGLKGL